MYLDWGAPGESDNLHAPPSNIKFIKRAVCAIRATLFHRTPPSQSKQVRCARLSPVLILWAQTARLRETPPLLLYVHKKNVSMMMRERESRKKELLLFILAASNAHA